MLNTDMKKNAQKAILFHGSLINSCNLIAQCLFIKIWIKLMGNCY